MQASAFFARLLQAPKRPLPTAPPDDLVAFDSAWNSIKETLEYPDERQLARGIGSTQVPRNLKLIVDALIYEANRTDEDTTGACLEYFLRHDMLSELERLCEHDRPHGVKIELLRATNNLVGLLSPRLLAHNAIHRPLQRLLRSCVGEDDEKIDGAARVVGAAAAHDTSDDADELEEDLVDLMCIICSRMRVYPYLLIIFFHSQGWLVPHDSYSGDTTTAFPPARISPPIESSEGPSSPQMHYDFLLFSYLLRFVHREGRTGDFARAGLLFLFDIAFLGPGDEGVENLSMTSTAEGHDSGLQEAREALAEYILDGDFADVMAAGLGAAYSMLPTKIRIPSLAEQSQFDPAIASGGMYLGGSEGDEIQIDEDVEDLETTTDIDVRNQLDLLLRLFGFLQDILFRCSSPAAQADPFAETVSSAQVLGRAISDAALAAVQTAFVDNVLYPSILECSTSDGSSVAVMTYLDVLFSNLEGGALLQRILDVLMDVRRSPEPAFSSPPKKTAPHRKQGAGALGFDTGEHPNYLTEEGRFTLRDLVLDNIHSTSGASRSAALHLLFTLLGDHCRQATPTLLSIMHDPRATAVSHPPLPPPGMTNSEGVLPHPINLNKDLFQEPTLYGGLVPQLDDAVQAGIDSSSGFSAYLADTQARFEADRCWQASRIPLQFVSADGKPGHLRVGEFETDPLQHYICPSDPLVRALLDALAAWFTSSPDENVTLTGAITTLARCPHRSLVGWLLYDNSDSLNAWAVARSREEEFVHSDASFWEREEDCIGSKPAKNALSGRPPPTQPAVFQVLRGLVQFVGTMRVRYTTFDRLLSERRQGLLFANHLDEAMTAAFDVDATGVPLSPTPLAALPADQPPVRKVSGFAQSIRSFLSPRRRAASTSVSSPIPVTPTPGTPTPGTPTPGTPTPAGASTSGPALPSTPSPAPPGTPLRQSFSAQDTSTSSTTEPPALRPETPPTATGFSTPPRRGPDPSSVRFDTTSPGPFKTHYAQLGETGLLQVSSVPPVSAGPWARARRATREASFSSPQFDETTPTARSLTLTPSAWSPASRGTITSDPDAAADLPEPRSSTTTFTCMLDNCIILEELIKELVAIIVMRRTLGIDQIGFLQ